MRACVFFDRDGIVNRSPGAGWIERWADFEWEPSFFDVFRAVRERGYECVLVTNQSGISRGVMTEAAVLAIHRNLRCELRARTGFDFLDVMVCPHQDHHHCACRKPKPGMILEAAWRHGLNLAASWMIGDQARDVEAGSRAGCRTLLVNAESMEVLVDRRVATMTALRTLVDDIIRKPVDTAGMAMTRNQEDG